MYRSIKYMMLNAASTISQNINGIILASYGPAWNCHNAFRRM